MNRRCHPNPICCCKLQQNIFAAKQQTEVRTNWEKKMDRRTNDSKKKKWKQAKLCPFTEMLTVFNRSNDAREKWYRIKRVCTAWRSKNCVWNPKLQCKRGANQHGKVFLIGFLCYMGRAQNKPFSLDARNVLSVASRSVWHVTCGCRTLYGAFVWTRASSTSSSVHLLVEFERLSAVCVLRTLAYGKHQATDTKVLGCTRCM